MTAVVVERSRTAKPDVRIIMGLALAAIIAWLQPFDRLFAAATLDSPVLRALLIVALALMGLWTTRRIGLRVEPAGEAAPVLFPVLVAAGVGAGCAGMDWLFRPVLPAAYVQLMTTGSAPLRTLGFMLRAFNENILYRLFLGTTLAWALGAIWKGADGRPSRAALFGGFALAQAVNIWVNITSHEAISALSLLHEVLRYGAPGMVWSWLFWRRGFQANEIASTSVHLVFQPLAQALLG